MLVAAMSLIGISRDAVAQNPSRAKGQARSVAPGSAENPARQRPVPAPVPLSIVPLVTTPPPTVWRTETNDEVYAELHIGTNVYRNAKILKTTSTNAMIKVDGGILRASASDLTPEIRQKYFSIERIVAVENSGFQELEARESRDAQARKEAAEAEKQRNYRLIDGRPESILLWPEIVGRIVLVMVDGVIIKRYEERYNKPSRPASPDQPSGSWREGGLFWSSTGRVFLKNYPFVPTPNAAVKIKARASVPYKYKTPYGTSETIPGYDCGL